MKNFPKSSGDTDQPPATSDAVDEPALTDAASVGVSASVPDSLTGGAATPSGAPDQSTVADAADVAATLRGDDDAFARLYDRHAPIVLAICRRATPGGPADPAEADDALQETFIRAHRQLVYLDAPERVRSWLLGIARRVCSERRRASGRRRRHEETAMTIHDARRSDASDAADSAVADTEALDRLGAALDHLPEAERLAIHLYYLDPDPVRAASDELGLSRSGFYKLLGRARDRLRALLEEAIADGTPRCDGDPTHGGQTA